MKQSIKVPFGTRPHDYVLVEWSGHTVKLNEEDERYVARMAKPALAKALAKAKKIHGCPTCLLLEGVKLDEHKEVAAYDAIRHKVIGRF